MDNRKTGKLIAELRKKKGLTQQQLADQLNLSNKTISKWESGAGSPDVGNLPVLADALGVTVDELLRGEVALHEEKEKWIPVTAKPTLTPEQKKERAIILFAACLGALFGVLAYNFGWLG
uniref:helix-turn-helix domain-containing protein n=1 Tax=Agathobacter sp. TaxID=2021311 RepID=UPI004056F30F